MLTNEFPEKERPVNYHKSSSEIERQIAEDKITANGLDQSNEDGIDRQNSQMSQLSLSSQLSKEFDDTLLTPRDDKKIIDIKLPSQYGFTNNSSPDQQTEELDTSPFGAESEETKESESKLKEKLTDL